MVWYNGTQGSQLSFACRFMAVYSLQKMYDSSQEKCCSYTGTVHIVSCG